MPNFASSNQHGIGRESSESQFGSYIGYNGNAFYMRFTQPTVEKTKLSAWQIFELKKFDYSVGDGAFCDLSTHWGRRGGWRSGAFLVNDVNERQLGLVYLSCIIVCFFMHGLWAVMQAISGGRVDGLCSLPKYHKSLASLSHGLLHVPRAVDRLEPFPEKMAIFIGAVIYHTGFFNDYIH
ncbi:hypothetical protein T03_15442 [Trichinella britovi]|uniref:Uncharacterized protein n=1 Tax=Trichinella britovi TaxID=45882 RepID=A0A0V1CZS3_TRIBR|nr:hypothetical protein T03_15442 [Trichinella britovi]